MPAVPGEHRVVVTCHDLMPFTTPGYYAGRFDPP
jgi:hypothetical protein